MRPVDQAELHNPPDTIGDCMRACVACILEVDPVDLPHFARAHYEHGLTHESVVNIERHVLRDRFGVDLLHVEPASCDTSWLPHGYCVATGESPRFPGQYHDVVWLMDASGGRMAFDPHPSRAGIVGRPVQFIFFVPMELKVAA